MCQSLHIDSESLGLKYFIGNFIVPVTEVNASIKSNLHRVIMQYQKAMFNSCFSLIYFYLSLLLFKVSMTSECHNHILQTNPWHQESSVFFLLSTFSLFCMMLSIWLSSFYHRSFLLLFFASLFSLPI